MPAPNSDPLALQPVLERNKPLIVSMWDAVVHRLDACGKLDELSCGGFRFSVGAEFSVFQMAA